MQQIKFLRSPAWAGAVLLVVLAVVAFTAALLYVSPPGQKIVVFYTDDATSVRPGEGARIAGITVGAVKDLAIEQNRVKVRIRVDNDAFVGDESQIQVRMLTLVGGYYVDLVSLGNKPLGKTPIPMERVTMPYSLMHTLTSAMKITENVSPKPIRESLDQIEQGLTGTNVETLSSVIDAGNAFITTIDKQRGQISAILNLSDEYIESLRNYSEGLKVLISKVSITEQTLELYSKGFAGALKGLGSVGDAVLIPLGKFWVEHREEFIEKVRGWQERVIRQKENNSRIVPRLRRIRDKISRVLDAQNAPPELLATDLCIPMPGSPC